ncbi:winged helix-turn-helix domain-containing tetratricopeptide repeat protein [Novilysobacter arseniciresistens]|uniref:winged helix-turn-helix domain-containing tetratricopeptide repeat protein n=1 Tax=Novilysobacter arseniciresistens TaxID=1385522 RepID=UPI00068A54D9|nr:winged helix-turn-helix domain-containing protein [Lysobacter arseniciresistens]
MDSAKAAAVCPPAIFEFADLALDTRQHAVFRGAARIPLPRLTYELLRALVEAAPALLTHDDIAGQVWRGRLVTPETIAQRVLLLRRALGDDAGNPRYLRVVRGLGCQIIPPVRVRRAASSPVPAAAESVTGLVHNMDLSLPGQPSIVVLPFDTDGDAGHRDIALGLTHDIATRVARTRAFFVIARGTAFRFAPGAHDPGEVSRALGVRYVVQGDVRVAGSSMHINVALADAVEGRELWADSFQRRLDNVFDAQEEITDLVVGAIAMEVELAERQRALLEAPANLGAWSAYHRGCWHMYRFTPQDYEQAERYFQLAARLDPGSARAFAGLSFVHWQRAFFDLSPDRAGEVERAFELALQSYSINPHEPLAHWALGRAHLLRGEMGDSITALDEATVLNPSFAVGQYTLGFALMQAGDTAHAIERAGRARRLSPYDPMGFAMIGVRGFSLTLDGHHDEAADVMALAVRQPNAHYHLVAMATVCDAPAERKAEARRNLARLHAAAPGYGERDFLRAFQLRQPAHARLVGDAFRRLGRLRPAGRGTQAGRASPPR